MALTHQCHALVDFIMYCILGLQSIPGDFPDKYSAAMLEENNSRYNNEILLFTFLQHGRHDVKCEPNVSREKAFSEHYIDTQNEI